ncbi:predicted protein [Nematostella vectensis]|uniref:Uncharacterized protein n=1 Tax=Nematostella vectensis TaxID=45351 RepID=A7RIG5_NEMVE|nr:predicted protein [Nematostella vectensis]|eukprot:XP_001640765.1 predicted protein [Nematostella vectensis]
MADFGQNTRSLSPVDFKHNCDARSNSLFFPTTLKDEQNGNKTDGTNGVCEDCIEDTNKSKVNTTQASAHPNVIGHKRIGFTTENSMFHDFPTSTTFWSPANIDDVFVQPGVAPVNGVHFSPNTQVLGPGRRPVNASSIPTSIGHQPRRTLPNSSQYIANPKPVQNINSLASGWNASPNHSMSGWPQQQPSSSWGRNYSTTNNAIINHRNGSRPSTLTFPPSSRLRSNGGTRSAYSGSRQGITAQSITQGLQSLNLSGQQPVDGTVLDNITGLGNSHGTNSELSNSLYSYQDSMKFPSLETRLLDIIRSPSDPPENLAEKLSELYVITAAFRLLYIRFSCHAKIPAMKVTKLQRFFNVLVVDWCFLAI